MCVQSATSSLLCTPVTTAAAVVVVGGGGGGGWRLLLWWWLIVAVDGGCCCCCCGGWWWWQQGGQGWEHGSLPRCVGIHVLEGGGWGHLLMGQGVGVVGGCALATGQPAASQFLSRLLACTGFFGVGQRGLVFGGGVSEVVLAWVAVQAVARCFCSSSSNNRRSDVHTHVLGTRFLDPITLLGGMHSGVAPPPPWLLLLLLLPSVLCSGMSRRWWSWWFSFPVCIHCGLCCLLPTPCDLFGWNKPAQLHPVLCQQAACDRMLL